MLWGLGLRGRVSVLGLALARRRLWLQRMGRRPVDTKRRNFLSSVSRFSFSAFLILSVCNDCTTCFALPVNQIAFSGLLWLMFVRYSSDYRLIGSIFRPH